MWVKNLILYAYEPEGGVLPEELASGLSERPFQPCGSQELVSAGWVPPMGRHSTELVHGSSDAMLITCKRQERLLPPSVVSQAVAEKVEALEAEQMRRLRKKERDEIRDEVMLDLMPRAFTKDTRVNVLIFPREQLLCIETSSDSRADEITALLRKTLGGLPAHCLATKTAADSHMTSWLQAGATLPSGINIGERATLTAPEEKGAVIRCVRQDLTADEITGHLSAGKRVTELAIEHAGRMSCVLTDDLSLKSIQFSDQLKEQAADQAGEDYAAQFDADWVLMSAELRGFVPQLVEIFGGRPE